MSKRKRSRNWKVKSSTFVQIRFSHDFGIAALDEEKKKEETATETLKILEGKYGILMTIIVSDISHVIAANHEALQQERESYNKLNKEWEDKFKSLQGTSKRANSF